MAHAAFLLPSGKVVVTGGFDPTVPGSEFDPAFTSTEVYDPLGKALAPGPT